MSKKILGYFTVFMMSVIILSGCKDSISAENDKLNLGENPFSYPGVYYKDSNVVRMCSDIEKNLILENIEQLKITESFVDLDNNGTKEKIIYEGNPYPYLGIIHGDRGAQYGLRLGDFTVPDFKNFIINYNNKNYLLNYSGEKPIELLEVHILNSVAGGGYPYSSRLVCNFTETINKRFGK